LVAPLLHGRHQWRDGSTQAEPEPVDKPDPVVNSCKVCHEPGANRCSKCKLVYYCSRLCQSKDWASHKDACKPKAEVSTMERCAAIDSNLGANHKIKELRRLIHERPEEPSVYDQLSCELTDRGQPGDLELAVEMSTTAVSILNAVKERGLADYMEQGDGSAPAEVLAFENYLCKVYHQLARAYQLVARFHVSPPGVRGHGDLYAAEAALRAALVAVDGREWPLEWEAHSDLSRVLYALATTQVGKARQGQGGCQIAVLSVSKMGGAQIEEYEAYMREARQQAMLGVEKCPLTQGPMGRAKSYHELGVVLTGCASTELEGVKYQDALEAFESAVRIMPTDSMSVNKMQTLRMNMEMIQSRTANSAALVERNRLLPDPR